MLDGIPVLGWLLKSIIAMSVAFPFWLVYSVLGIGEVYFYWLPEVYQSLPYWHTVGLVMVIDTMKSVLLPAFTNPFSNVGNRSKS